jgi:formate dehydrogenase assembly factor FdhD
VELDPLVAFETHVEPAALEIRVNFGVFAGREATPAELEELAQALLPEVGEVSVVGEQRHEVSVESEGTVHQVRIDLASEQLPDDEGEVRDLTARLLTVAEQWARSCIAERSIEVEGL